MRYFIQSTIYVFILSCNLIYSQNIEKELTFILDSTLADNPEAIGFLIDVQSPSHSLSWSYANGYSNKETKEILDKNQPVLIASNTKTFVAAAILKLIELEKINLDQSIKSLLYKKTRKKLIKKGYDLDAITISHLLSHTSGITDYVDDNYFAFVAENPLHQWTRDEQIDYAAKIAKPSKVGQTFSYGDINYVLLTEIIEQISKKPFYTAMRELLNFRSLNINNTWFVNLEEKPNGILPFAHQYSKKHNWDSYEINPSWDLYGGGGLASTSQDLAIFFQELFHGKIINDTSILQNMYTYVLPMEESNYCLGIRKISFHGDIAYYHGGFWGTDVMYIPKYDMSIAIAVMEKDYRMLNAEISNLIIQKILHPQ